MTFYIGSVAHNHQVLKCVIANSIWQAKLVYDDIRKENLHIRLATSRSKTRDTLCWLNACHITGKQNWLRQLRILSIQNGIACSIANQSNFTKHIDEIK